MGYDLDIPSTLQDARTYRLLSLYHFIYSMCGLVLGLASIVGGVFLFLNGVSGSSSWTARLIGSQTQVSDAAPGTILFVVGLFVVMVTRFTVRTPKSEREPAAPSGPR